MYSRFSYGQGRQVNIPEHYSGYAFSDSSDPPLPPPPTEAPVSEPSLPDPHPVPEPVSEEADGTVLPVGNTLQKLFSRNRFLGGIETDQLLLIGMILLLADSEADRDVLLWMVLLLFCK